MPYLSATDYVALLPGVPTITASSRPLTMGEVATVIARTSLEIDSAAAHAGYSVPISASAQGYGMIEELCGYGVGWKVLRTFFPNLGGKGGDMGLAGEYRSAYRSGIEAIRKGEQPILGAGLDTSESSRLLPRSYSTSNTGATAGVDPHFDMDYEF